MASPRRTEEYKIEVDTRQAERAMGRVATEAADMGRKVERAADRGSSGFSNFASTAAGVVTGMGAMGLASSILIDPLKAVAQQAFEASDLFKGLEESLLEIEGAFLGIVTEGLAASGVLDSVSGSASGLAGDIADADSETGKFVREGMAALVLVGQLTANVIARLGLAFGMAAGAIEVASAAFSHFLSKLASAAGAAGTRELSEQLDAVAMAAAHSTEELVEMREAAGGRDLGGVMISAETGAQVVVPRAPAAPGSMPAALIPDEIAEALVGAIDPQFGREMGRFDEALEMRAEMSQSQLDAEEERVRSMLNLAERGWVETDAAATRAGEAVEEAQRSLSDFIITGDDMIGSMNELLTMMSEGFKELGDIDPLSLGGDDDDDPLPFEKGIGALRKDWEELGGVFQSIGVIFTGNKERLIEWGAALEEWGDTFTDAGLMVGGFLGQVRDVEDQSVSGWDTMTKSMETSWVGSMNSMSQGLGNMIAGTQSGADMAKDVFAGMFATLNAAATAAIAAGMAGTLSGPLAPFVMIAIASSVFEAVIRGAGSSGAGSTGVTQAGTSGDFMIGARTGADTMGLEINSPIIIGPVLDTPDSIAAISASVTRAKTLGLLSG